MQRLLELPDYVVVLPSHYGGSVCGRGLSGARRARSNSGTTTYGRKHRGAWQHQNLAPRLTRNGMGCLSGGDE